MHLEITETGMMETGMLLGREMSPVIPVMALLVVGAAYLAIRFRQRFVAIRADRDQLLDAMGRLESGDYSCEVLDLQSPAFEDVGLAYGKMVPNIRSAIETLEWHAEHDALTSIFNANSFKKHCIASMARETDPSLKGGAMLFFDINDFKKINDSLGHEAGDRFLVICADRVRLACSTFKSSKLAALVADAPIGQFDPIIGRIGGDEFGIFLPGSPSFSEVERFVFRLQRLISEPCQIGVHSLSAKISVGISFSGDHHEAYDQLLAAADTAMYDAKTACSGSHRFYHPSMRALADEILARELEIRNGLQNSQFVLYFQPQIDVATNRIESAEALIRWHHPVRGIVSPDEFIPFAETYDLIDDIGDWVLGEAIATAARWHREGIAIRLSINISPKQLNRVELIPLVRALLAYHGLPPSAIELEITEAALMRNSDVAIERINGLRMDGVSIALDDFGTGYSNFAQLLGLPIDRLKLDRSLIDSNGKFRRSRLVVTALVELASKLGLDVVAEGVETEPQLAFLRQSRCQLAQGFLFSQPVPEAEFLRLLEDQKTDGAIVAVA